MRPKPRPPDGAPAVLGHVVEYRRDSLPWTRLTADDSNTLKLTNLQRGTYAVRVRAVGEVGDSLPATLTVVVP